MGLRAEMERTTFHVGLSSFCLFSHAAMRGFSIGREDELGLPLN